MLKKFLVLLCLTGFAITQPVLTIFGSNPELFYFHNIENLTLVLVYAGTVALLPAIVLWLLISVAGAISKPLGRSLYLLTIALLSGLWLVQLLKWSFGLHYPALLVVMGSIGGVLFLLAVRRWKIVESWLQIVAIAPLITVGFFLFMSDTGVAIVKASATDSVDKSQRELPNVIFIILDEFPTLGLLDKYGELDTVRFPALGELASEATWYRHYSVVHSSTRISVPSILSGSVPKDATPDFSSYPHNLFSLLAPTHHLAAFESLTSLCGLDTCSESAPGSAIKKPPAEIDKIFAKTKNLWLRRISLHDQGGADLDDFEETFEQESTKIPMPKRMKRFLGVLYPGKPTLYFMHLELPHVPWRFYASGDRYFMPLKNTDSEFSNRDGGEWMAQIKEYRFLMQAQYVDILVSLIIDRLKATGMWDNALIVLTADHGRTFRYDAPGREMRPKTYEGVAYAPLFVKSPHQKTGRIDDSNLMSYDILATISDILNVELPWKTAGLPAGSKQIALRGDVKKAVHRSTESSVGNQVSFSDKEHFPNFASRWIGSVQDVEKPLTLLNGRLQLDRFFNRTPAEFRIEPGGSAVVIKLPQLQRSRGTPMGAVIGSLEDKTATGKILIAVNGQIVTASPLITYRKKKNAFFALLPAGVLERENKIEIFLVDGDALIALTLSEEIPQSL